MAEYFNSEYHRNKEIAQAKRHIQVWNIRFQILTGTHLGNRCSMNHQGAAKSKSRCHADTGRGRTHIRKQTQKIAKENEEKHRPQEGNEPVGVMFADGRFGHLFSDESQQAFKRVPKSPANRLTRLHAPSQRYINGHDQASRNQFQDHEFCEKTRKMDGKPKAFEKMPFLGIHHVFKRTSRHLFLLSMSY